MRILALEFSSEPRSAAVLAGPRAASGVSAEARRDFGPLALIDHVLREAGIEREAIECIAIGLGPGSYGGIRAAIALAQGWHLASGVRLLGVSSMEVLAAQVQAAGVRGRIGLVAYAQRGDFYWVEYEIREDRREVVRALCLAGREVWMAAVAGGQPVFSPDAGVERPGVRRMVPSAAVLAGLAVEHGLEVLPEQLEPISLRAPSFVKAPPPREIPGVPGK